MAQFRGWIQGNRGAASRLGSKTGGLTLNAASWEGAVSVRLWHDQAAGYDYAEISLTKHVNGAGTERLLYKGPVSGASPQTCECADPGCPVCKGSCSELATDTVYRVDMEDQAGTPTRDGCTEDALASGIFATADESNQ